MPDASASGADTGSGSARSRDHNQGNQERKYTVEQKAAVLRIRKCNATAFYDILNLEEVKKTCTESDIKKAYRKQSLLTHPDKNGHEHADEAFKMVSRAFGVLGDKEKREKFDQFGTDPDSRFASAQAQSPFSGFASRAPSGGMGRAPFEADMSPEEMFARFFGGGGGFNGGPFGGPQFVFNFGGGPGIRVHQFGGARPQRRPRDPRQQQQQQQEGFNFQSLISILPILLFFIFPLLQSIFSGASSFASTPSMVYDNAQHPFTEGRKLPTLNAQYFVKPEDIASYSKSKLNALDRTAENNFIRKLQSECEYERLFKQRLREQAQGWFFQDPDKMEKARQHKMPNCERLKGLGVYR